MTADPQLSPAHWVARYRRQLRDYLLRRLRRPEDVDDLAQEVYLRLLRVDDSTLVRKPLPFLYGIASHVLAEFRGKVRDDEEHVTMDSETFEQWVEQPTQSVADDIAEQISLRQQLERALARLPPKQAAVLILHNQQGLSYQEVAEKLNISVHTVEKYLVKAKARIRTMPWER